MGLRMKRNRPQKPIYFDRQPADQSRTRYSTPKNTTRQISIQNKVSFANLLYSSIVDNTLNIRHTKTSKNLKWKKKKQRKMILAIRKLGWNRSY